MCLPNNNYEVDDVCGEIHFLYFLIKTEGL